jgi:hypothetical protein
VKEKSESKSVEPKPKKKAKKLNKPKKAFIGYTETQYAEYKEYFN